MGIKVSRYFISVFFILVIPVQAYSGKGFSAGLLFLTGIEIFDGFSPGYGFSWGDKAANVLGTAMLVSQEMLWQEQRFRIKFSYSPSPYTGYRPELLGRNLRESWLKDYNGQTYWLSFSPGSFDEGSFIPDWLCLSLGYSGGGMTGGSCNPEFNGAGERLPEFTRHRQYFFSLDLNLTRLEKRSPVLLTLFSAFGFVKIPFPALEYNSQDGIRLRPFYF